MTKKTEQELTCPHCRAKTLILLNEDMSLPEAQVKRLFHHCNSMKVRRAYWWEVTGVKYAEPPSLWGTQIADACMKEVACG